MKLRLLSFFFALATLATNGQYYVRPSFNINTRTKTRDPKTWDYRKNEVAEDLKLLEPQRRDDSTLADTIPAKRDTLVTVFDKKNETKDGFYVNGYVVNISHEKGQELDGKKVRISGKVSIVKAVKNPVDKNGEVIQGRSVDTKYIDKPTIEILH